MFSGVIVAEKCRFSPFCEIVETTQKSLGESAEYLSNVTTNCSRAFPLAAPTSRLSSKRRCSPSPCGEEHFWQVLLRLVAASLPLPRGDDGADNLIGGQGADILIGSAGDDLLIAGFTNFDAVDAALLSLLAEWSSTRSHADRVANLSGTGTGPRLNGNNFLIVQGASRTVFDDGAVDSLTGDAGLDWFLLNLDGDGDPTKRDRVTDKRASEAATDINL